jgi:Abortive infection alpha
MIPDNELELAKEAVNAGIAQSLAPFQDLLRQLLGPAATEVGLAWGASMRLWRLKRLVRVFDEFQKFITEKGLSLKPVAMKTLFPLLEGATLEDNEDLHQRWVALLVNAARTDNDGEVPAYFPDILRQLSCEEARFLDSAYNETTVGAEQRRIELQKKHPDFRGDASAMLGISGKLISTVHPIAVDNLERLRLVTRNLTALAVDDVLTNSFGADNHLYISGLGSAFVKACRFPK